MDVQRYNLTDKVLAVRKYIKEHDSDQALDGLADIIKYISRLEQALDRSQGWKHYLDK